MILQKPAYKKSSFAPAFFFLSKGQRAALADYYEFCRIMDDIADEETANPYEQLDQWKTEIARIYNNSAETDLGKRLEQDIKTFQIPEDRFLLLVEGMRADLDGKKYNSWKELDWYLYRVAVIVGKATLDILGIKGTEADTLAIKLGSAVQLTNIVRDVQEDAQLGRVYLPCAVTAEQILNDNYPPSVITTIKEAAQKAHVLYQQSFARMKQFPRLKMLPCRIMGYVYLKNLAKIESRGYDVLCPVKLTKGEKIRMVLYALFKTLF